MSSVIANAGLAISAVKTTHSAPPYLHASTAGRAYAIVRWILGTLLLRTAILKMSGGAASEVMQTAMPFISPRLYLTAILFEAILGGWLILGIGAAWSWLIALGFFAVLSAMSFRLGWLGAASCGCFGKIEVSPWWAFAIDLTAIAALIRFRPPKIGSGIRSGLPQICGCAVILAAIIGFLALKHGSLASAIAHIRGEAIVAEPELTDIGDGRVGEFQTFPVRLVNHGDKTARIVGGTSACSCVATDDLPIDIPSNGAATITVQMQFKGTAGVFRRRFLLYTDDEELRIMPVAVTGRLVE